MRDDIRTYVCALKFSEINLHLRQAEGDYRLRIFVNMNAPKVLDKKNLFKMKTLNIDRIYLHTNHKRFIYI